MLTWNTNMVPKVEKRIRNRTCRTTQRWSCNTCNRFRCSTRYMYVPGMYIYFTTYAHMEQNKHRMVESTTISSYNYTSMMYTTCTTHLIFIFFNHHNIIGWPDSFGGKLWHRLFKFHFHFQFHWILVIFFPTFFGWHNTSFGRRQFSL